MSAVTVFVSGIINVFASVLVRVFVPFFLNDCEMLDEGIEQGWAGIISVVGMSGHKIGGDFQLRAGPAGVEN